MSANDLVELAKRRGYFFQANEAYGGVSGFYVYGPQGAAFKENVEDAWRDRFVVEEGHREIDAPTVMPEAVFEASGHLDTFDDMLVECAECGRSNRADHLVEDNTDVEEAESYTPGEIGDLIAEHDLRCPNCDAELAGEPVEDFNLMFETSIGPGNSSPGYLRPETAQGIFVEFPRLAEYARNQLPFGVAQIGRAYRNEISPRNALLRVRELTQAELEQFVDPEEDEPPLERVADVPVTLYPATEQENSEAQRASDRSSGEQSDPREDGGQYVETTVGDAVEEGIVANDWVAYYLGLGKQWYESIGVDVDRFRFRQHLAGERSHYAVDCWDAEGEVSAPSKPDDSADAQTVPPSDGDWIELAGFAYRGDYDLSKHDAHSDEEFTVFKQYDEPRTVERATVDPDMSYLGPEFGSEAADVADALASLAERDRAAFDAEEVAVEVGGEEHAVPVERTGFSVDEVTESGEHITPHVVEPSFGVGRAVYTALIHAYETDEIEGDTRRRLALEPELAPTFVGVFPLMDKDGMGERAREIADDLRSRGLDVAYDDSGNIGRRYRRQDEIGTPFCVTVDYDSLEDETVTVRERDSTRQVRVPVDDLPDVLAGLRTGETTFDDLPERTDEPPSQEP